jgi:predicted RNase H-like HicB family nuclease
MKDDRYTYRVTRSEEDEEYVGLCAEFPSSSWLARTPEAALKGIRKVVADVVMDMQENGELLPEPIASRPGFRQASSTSLTFAARTFKEKGF